MPKTPPKEFREEGATSRSDYADPKNYKYPLHTEANVRAAISYFSQPKNAQVYPMTERKAVWARIKRAAKQYKIELSPESGPPSLEKSMTELNDLCKALHAFDIDAGLEKSYDGVPMDAPSNEMKFNEEENSPDKQMMPGEVNQTLANAEECKDEEMEKTEDSAEPEMADLYSKADPAANYPVKMQNTGSTVWSQGADARVYYSSIEDEVIAKAVENGTLSPELGAPYNSPLYGLRACSACPTQFNKAITVCPSCGTNALTSAQSSQQGLQMTKAVRDSITPRVEQDIILPE